MVQVSDIKDEESLRAWLEDQPRAVSVWIASRAAARVLPVWWDAVLSEEWARKRDLQALPILRSLLISSVAAFVPTDDIRSAAGPAAAAAHASARSAARAFDIATAAIAASSSAADATTAAADDATTGAAAHASATAADAVIWADVWTATRTDADQVTGGAFPDALPLWPEGARPLAVTWESIKTQVAEADGAQDWQFWIDWYDSLLDGRPMLGDAARTWAMLEKIALIDPEIWDKGPEVVNPVIRGIWELHRLRAEVVALQAEKAAFLAVQASAAHRGHNQPPEGLVDDAPEVARAITIIWDGLDEARDELEQVAPDKGVVRAIAERMLAALKAVVAYCGMVADTVVMSAAKVGGGAVGTGMLDHFANNGRLMQFAKDLLAYGLGG